MYCGCRLILISHILCKYQIIGGDYSLWMGRISNINNTVVQVHIPRARLILVKLDVICQVRFYQLTSLLGVIHEAKIHTAYTIDRTLHVSVIKTGFLG